MDFEISARKAIKSDIPSKQIIGVFFPLYKGLMDKGQKQKNIKKNIFKKTFNLIFALINFCIYTRR